jgi:uncharacterized membrane protein YkvA (DUF1232 family)
VTWPAWWELLVGAVAGLLLAWLLLVALLWRAHPGRPDVLAAVRLLPDLLRLVSRLARDRTLPRRVRVLLWLLLAYLASPVDLVPDVVPVVGYADDALAVALVLRSVVRAAGAPAIRRHWPGDGAGLATVLRLAGLRAGARP